MVRISPFKVENTKNQGEPNIRASTSRIEIRLEERTKFRVKIIIVIKPKEKTIQALIEALLWATDA